MSEQEQKVVLITGANRGIGYEVARQLGHAGLHVILTARNEEKGRAAVARLEEEGLTAGFSRLDLDDPSTMEATFAWVKEKVGSLDVLINNAAISLDQGEATAVVSDTTLRSTFDTNVIGTLQVIQTLLPVMGEGGRILNVSSTQGQLSTMEGGQPAYRMGKAALNAMTCILADELKDDGVSVNAVCPGWVRTEMGSPEAPLSVEEGADTLVWLATHPDPMPTGKFFRERSVQAW
jgi:NAD(P)-dependent dehydrogenase (short-subunit alcohol dehydrogenase family)